MTTIQIALKLEQIYINDTIPIPLKSELIVNREREKKKTTEQTNYFYMNGENFDSFSAECHDKFENKRKFI